MTEPANRIGVGRSAAILTVGGMVEFALQFLVPVILVRYLEAGEFGVYRLLTLTLGTALALAPAFMPQSLYFYLPAASEARRRLVIGNVIAYLALMGILVAAIASPLNPLGGAMLHSLFHASHGLSALYLGLSVLLSITATVAIAEGRIIWHFTADLCIALLRSCLIAGAAILTRDLFWVVLALTVDACIRVAVGCAYLATRPGGMGIGIEPALLAGQLRYSLPFALGASLFAMRAQADQWIAVSLLPPAAFAAFTIGAVVLPVASLIRQPINNAMLPSLSTAFAAGRMDTVQRLLINGSSAATLILMPIAGTLFVLAPEIVALVYTDQYMPAVPAMRIYLVLIMMQSFAIGYAMPILDLGKVAVRINALGLAISVGFSLAGAWCFGLAGAALGSVVAFAVSETSNMRVIARLLGTSFWNMLPLRLMLITGASAGSGLLVALLVDTGAWGGLWQVVALKLALYGSVVLAVFAVAGGMGEVRRARRSA